MTEDRSDRREVLRASVFVGALALATVAVVVLAFTIVAGRLNQQTPTRWIVRNATSEPALARLVLGGSPGPDFRIGPGETRTIPDDRLGYLAILSGRCETIDSHDPMSTPPEFMLADVGASGVTWHVVTDATNAVGPAPLSTQCP